MKMSEKIFLFVAALIVIAAMVCAPTAKGAVVQIGDDFFGLSSDATPTKAVSNRSKFIETDTKKQYLISGGSRTAFKTDYNDLIGTPFSGGVTTDGVNSLILTQATTSDWQSGSQVSAALTPFAAEQNYPRHAGVWNLQYPTTGSGTITFQTTTATFYTTPSRTGFVTSSLSGTTITLVDQAWNHIYAHRDMSTFMASTDSTIDDNLQYISVVNAYRNGNNFFLPILFSPSSMRSDWII